jgi:hypothetical protein
VTRTEAISAIASVRLIVGIEDALHRWLVRHSAMALRVSVGAVYLVFGIGASSATSRHRHACSRLRARARWTLRRG